ncbi:MAG: hypothetical protein CVU84_07410 [Firmicutes bacterium HGW-Firmicutes-1]|jgi:hypothetical protein|nr:MAG: hypothetical protein CVU84_07410 [Firmicutes bacterium HGW-Firmicutes-1]
MFDETIVLAAASTYDKKYYFNDEFNQLPQSIKDELKIVCVMHTADVGGVITISFDEEGTLLIEASADEEDVLYDEIGSHLKVRKTQVDKKELWEALETYFKVFYLGEE